MLLRCIIVVLAARLLSAQQPLDDAARALEAGDPAAARAALEPFIQAHPRDVGALVLMGVALDSAQHFADAAPFYERALQIAPNSPQALNNAANHYLAAGDRNRARRLFQRVLALEPGHVNARLQLAQLAVEDKHGADALALLSALPDAERRNPANMVLRAQALALAGRCAELDPAQIAGAGAPLQFSLGMALASCARYSDAENAFSQALDSDPGNFDTLYNLGIAALRAGHTERAADVLSRAQKLRSDDADCTFALAQALAARQQLLESAALLVRARATAPQRADIALLLAQISARLQFYEDAAAAYNDYLKLKPNDDAARRERGFAYARGGDVARAILDLEWYVRRHPQDAVGWYELGAVRATQSPSEALRALDRAIACDPDLVDAHYTRALINLQQGHTENTVADLLTVVKREPNNPRALATLGRAYMATNRTEEAIAVLKRAAELAPGDAGVLWQYGRALLACGRNEEGSAIMRRLKEAPARQPRPASGLVAFLNLPPADQRERYIENLRKRIAANPGNIEWKLSLAAELFDRRENTEAVALLREVRASTTDAAVLARCGSLLLENEEYRTAQEFLVSAGPSARLDLAIAMFHTEGPERALAELDTTEPAQRQGDYYLLRAELLDAMGRAPEAADALNHGIRASPTRPALYLEAAGFLLKREQFRQALDLLEGATHLLPDARELFLAQAITLELLNRRDDERKLLARIEARWPEWDRAWLLKGILLESEFQSAEARQALETAIALGANTPEAYYYLALAISHADPDNLAGAQDAVAHALRLTSSDAYIWLLAGRLALAGKDYAAAVDDLARAIRISPRLIAAHDALRRAYSAMGNEERAAAEVAEMKQITDKAPDQGPLPVGTLLFTVHR